MADSVRAEVNLVNCCESFRASHVEDSMKRVCGVCATLVLIFTCAIRVNAQKSAPAQVTRPLVLTEAIPLEGVKGRIDHFGSAGNRLLISALGNNTSRSSISARERYSVPSREFR